MKTEGFVKDVRTMTSAAISDPLNKTKMLFKIYGNEVMTEDVNSNFKVISLTRLGINPESRALEADVFATRPSELLKTASSFKKYFVQFNSIKSLCDRILMMYIT